MYWFLPLTRSHPSWKATFLMLKGWPHTVSLFYCISLLHTEYIWPQSILSGLPLVREKSEKFKVREKSGNFRICQGNLEFCWKSGKFKKSQGNLRKFIFHKRLRWPISISKNFQLAPLALTSYFLTLFFLNLPFFTKICYLKHIQTCT